MLVQAVHSSRSILEHFIGVDGRGVLVQVARVRGHVPRLEVNHLVVESQFHCFSSVAKLLSSSDS